MSRPQSKRAEIAGALGVGPAEVSLAVEVGPTVSLIPEAVAGDTDPQTAEEIALATGPLRNVAARLFDSAGQSADAARTTTLLTNRLPKRGRATAPDRAALCNQAPAPPAARPLHPTPDTRPARKR